MEADAGTNGWRVPRLRIVHAVRSGGFAGVERYVATVTTALAARGHAVAVIGGEPTAMRDVLRGSDVAYLPAARTAEVTTGLLRTARDADVIHLHMTAAEWAAVLTWPVVRRPLVATRHFAARRGRSVAVRIGSRLVRRRLALQIAISKFVADAVGEPTVTLLNGVADDDPVDPVNHVVLVAQRLEPEKRTTEALLAWEASGLDEDGWRLAIAGDGSERGQLEATASRMGMRNVTFLGRCSDLPDRRRQAGIFLATAPYEPFGLSVAEAMAAGLPVVACGAGGHLETVGAARPDLMYQSGAPEDCAAVLRRLANGAEYRRQAGADLRVFQQRFLGIDRHVDALIGHYLAVVGYQAQRASTRCTGRR